MDVRYSDPDCGCQIEYPGAYRRWCEHCRTEGPLPGSLADPEWETRRHDPAVLREAASRLDQSDPSKAEFLRIAADEIDAEPV
jgi:hypothetical protein